MDDSDFESLRLAFNRSGKRTKINLPKAPVDGQAAKNREFSPWANNLSAEFSAPCGPSEEEKLSHARKLEIKLDPVQDKTKEVFYISNKIEITLVVHICIFQWIWMFNLIKIQALSNVSLPNESFTHGLGIPKESMLSGFSRNLVICYFLLAKTAELRYNLYT